MAGFQKALENLNEGTLCICASLSLWLLLIAARMDGFLTLPYWAIFLPLWLWKIIVFMGWIVGFIVWFKQLRTFVDTDHVSYIREDPALPYVQAISVSAFFHLIIVCSEILLCIHLSIPSSNLSYLTILAPLLVVGALGVFGFLFVMIDSRSIFSRGSRRRRPHSRVVNGSETLFVTSRPRHACSFTLELCIAANLLQLLFLIARLDGWIRSNWVVTFIPTFILLAMGFLFCLAGLTVALITYFTAGFIPLAQRRMPVCYYASRLLVVILLCTSLIFLGLKLDGFFASSKGIYTLTCIPVLLSMLLYISLSSGPGNPWWFGLNRNVLLAIFESCPALQLCANTKISKSGLCRPRHNDSQNTRPNSSPGSPILSAETLGAPSISNRYVTSESTGVTNPVNTIRLGITKMADNSTHHWAPYSSTSINPDRPLLSDNTDFTDFKYSDHLLNPD